MSTPPTPELPERPSDMRGEDSPSARKRSRADMESGQQGAQSASPIEIPSSRASSTHSQLEDDELARVTPTPSIEHGKRQGDQSGTQPHTNEDEQDPEALLDDFDWRELEARYHDAMRERQDEEQALFREFERLMTFFQIWAGTTATHEVDRTFTRLRTRMAHVQHSEEELDKKRDHYIAVVSAFERALNLLEGRI